MVISSSDATPGAHTSLHRYLKDLRTQRETDAVAAQKRGAEDGADGQPGAKRPRGRPKGSRNSKKAKVGADADVQPATPGQVGA